jgi:anti-sigma regulatory factor (Ser/Thr protein kinase)/predicted transcriptional regulator
MSLSDKDKNKIKKHILELIERNEPKVPQKIKETFNISLTSVYRYINELIEDRIILKQDNDKVKYLLVEKTAFFTYFPGRTKLEEDIIYHNDIEPFFDNISSNSQKVWNHAFTEIMNNAVDHADAKEIRCYLTQNKLNGSIMIRDDGVGIFNKIVEYNKNVLGRNITIDDAIAELFTGKFTTDSANHSGEGIFFTSRLVDKFIIYSEGRRFSHDSYDTKEIANFFEWEDTSEVEILLKQKGTIVLMKLSNNSRRNIEEVLNSFSDAARGFF